MSVNYAANAAAGAASSTSATAGIISIYNPASATMVGARIYEWEIGPAANSADETYTVRWRRNTTASTWTNSITPSDAGPKATTAITLAGANSSARGTLTAGNIGAFGFHMRGGYRWVSIPGGELSLPYVFSNGLELEYYFAQGTSVLAPCVYFYE